MTQPSYTRGQPRIPMDVRAQIRAERNTACPCCGLLPPFKRIAEKYSVSISVAAKIANERTKL